MIVAADPVIFRSFRATDYSSVASLWTRINRELAPVGMEKLFEQYIAMTIDGELNQLLEVFLMPSVTPFGSWKAKMGLLGRLVLKAVAGATRSFAECTLMKVTAAWVLHNACLIVQRQKRVARLPKMIVSTAQIQKAADRFYRKSGFQQIRTEVAEIMTAKQAGGGLTRFYFEKVL